MSSTGRQAFRFLNLHKDARLMVYDVLPSNKCRRLYVLDSNNQVAGITVIVKNLLGLAIIYTCRDVCGEATVLRRRRVLSGSMPLHLDVEEREMNKDSHSSSMHHLKIVLRLIRRLRDPSGYDPLAYRLYPVGGSLRLRLREPWFGPTDA
ncbi:uncharacterized protein M421DRAFT_405643 [Didymella exigua CBS 183.55]|uniref:Uncharacterized protein n=1 Tax=Didymella exigua CBS 183.55 TaxID=1150837 RepID=A0A6A5RA17_9PLEO|nr:uncharacterized protein M421DRAFT_405643 [Didymella exigua CBS 183.55]KAF1923506.1 hypothetical protein M421DRAFT_405643 [Didymella exigua CBS 183.55]